MHNKEIFAQFDEDDSYQCFELLRAAFEQAAEKTHLQKRFFRIGDHNICLSFASAAMLDHIVPAIAHLETSPTADPELTICIWDSASTKTQLPGLLPVFIQIFHWYWHEYLDGRQNIKPLCNDRFLASLKLGANVFSMLDWQTNTALYWIKDEADLPYWDKSSPLQVILSWWLGRHQRQYVHAAAVGMPAGGVLIAAKGGSGKSTSALSCLSSELSYVGDDYCLVATEPEPYAYSLYCTGKLKGAKDFERLPQLAHMCSNQAELEEEKAVFFFKDYFPDKIISGFPLRAILVPKITGKKDTHIIKSSTVAGLKALAPSTLFQLSGTGKNAMGTMADLARQLPCYALELGTEIEQIPKAISCLLEDLNAEAISIGANDS
ncbi:serine kinase [cf. Phormidesmis sp. LEGE 11477]|nr:serine kinase [cf. Phormidesmis sp. LEGE 11477]